MQFEEFDDSIRAAADQHHPNYDEKAWARMEKLLDREMPQSDDRRRRFLFLLLMFLLLGGAAWLLTTKPWQSETLGRSQQANKVVANPVTSTADSVSKKVEVRVQAEKHSDPALLPVQAGTPDRPSGSDLIRQPVDAIAGKKAMPVETRAQKGIKDRVNESKMPQNRRVNQPGDEPVAKSGSAANATITPGGKRKSSQPLNRSDKAAIRPTAPELVRNTNSEPGKSDVAANTVSPTQGNTQGREEAANSNANNENVAAPGKATNPVTASPAADTSKEQKVANAATPAKKGTSKKKNGFSFSFSAGPDISSVGMSNFGKTKLATGAGVVYNIGSRWAIRTGFYSASKVYDAAPDDYKPADPVMYRNYLKNISADCKVYEIPLLVNYNIGKSTRQNMFVSAGLSSLIMKKENYLYQYKYPNGTSYSYPHNIDNKYRHYFSVLSLSAGYQRRISRTIAIAAEPYVKMPLSGVGYGKIKLNSTGVLVSLIVSPFSGGKR